MNNIVAVRICREYDPEEIYSHIADIYTTCNGPDVRNKKVLLKPNLLSDSPPEKCITTHPVVFEAMARYLQENGAIILAGDSPAVHIRGFKPVKSGIFEVCEKLGIPWVDFNVKFSYLRLKNGRIRIASVINDVNLIISLPKLKNHELVYFTGAIKNTLGLAPGFVKAKQHALYQNRESFSRFLIDLNEAITPHFFLMDGIAGMEGHGPAQGNSYRTEVLIGSSNPLALDLTASRIAGYNPLDIPTNRISLDRGLWLTSQDEVSYDGPAPENIIRKDFKRIHITPNRNISLSFVTNRVRFLRKLERRPVFNHEKCTGCSECIKICPENAIVMNKTLKNHVVLNDRKCIRCFCCSEVCRFNAVKVRIKLFGV